MKEPPRILYLQWGKQPDPEMGITWYEDKINNDDVPYIRVDSSVAEPLMIMTNATVDGKCMHCNGVIRIALYDFSYGRNEVICNHCLGVNILDFSVRADIRYVYDKESNA